jgi:hypothetical protein
MIIFAAGGCLLIIFLIGIEFTLGFPSSTSSLALLALPPAAVVGAVIGVIWGLLYVVLGCFIRMPFFHLDKSAFFRLIGISVLLIAFCVPLVFQILWNINDRPRVIINKNKIADATLVNIGKKVEEFKQTRGVQRERNRIYRCDSKYNISYDSHSITIEFLKINKKVTYHLRCHDYIRNIQFYPFINDSDRKEYLVVFSQLRTTSRKIIYSIFSSQGECVYQKLEKR